MIAYPLFTMLLLAASLLLLIAGVLVLTREESQGRMWLFVYLLAAAFWSLMEAFCHFEGAIPPKILMLKIRYLGIIAVPFSLLYYIMGSLETPLARHRKMALLVSSPLLLSLAAVWTNDYHRLFWTGTEIISRSGVMIPRHSFGLLFYLFYVYALGLILSALFLMLYHRRRGVGLVSLQHQFSQVFLILFIPFLMNLFSLTGMVPWPDIFPTVFGFSVVGLLLSVNFLRFQIQELGPLVQQKILTIIPDGIVVLDTRDRILLVNSGLGFSPAEKPETYLGKPLAALEERFPGIEKVIRQGRLADWLEWDDTGREMFWDVRAAALQDRKYNLRGRLFTFRDVTARKALEKNLKHLATTDSLTGAYNRRYFSELAEVGIKQARRYEHPVSLLYVDVDHFKRVNDTWGHDRGDAVLVEIVNVLKSGLREADLLGRMGGEEFVVFLPHCELPDALKLGNRLMEWIRALRVDAGDGYSISCTVSMGAVQLHDEESFDTLLIRGDLALYRAKESGRNRIVWEMPQEGVRL